MPHEAKLFDAFYRNLGTGASVATALRVALLERMASGTSASSWAGVVIIGDGAMVPLPGGRGLSLPSTWILALAAR